MGAQAYSFLKCYANHFTRGQNVIEIGSERGEGSTRFLYNLCKKRQLNFYTVDFDPQIFQNARSIAGDAAHLQEGTEFLRSFEGPISFAYLDNFDWDWGGMEVQISLQKERYKELGQQLNNDNSQNAHLEQTKLIESKADSLCLILFDDTYFDPKYNNWSGKGGKAVTFLQEKGFTILLSNPKAVKNEQYVLVKRGVINADLRFRFCHLTWELDFFFHKSYRHLKSGIKEVLRRILPSQIYLFILQAFRSLRAMFK